MIAKIEVKFFLWTPWKHMRRVELHILWFLIFAFGKHPPTPIEQKAGWTREAVCRREKSLASVENWKTIPQLSCPQPSHYTNYIVLPPYIEFCCITSNTLNKDPSLITVTILKLTYVPHILYNLSNGQHRQITQTGFMFWIMWFNILKTKRNLLYMRNQSVPRSKHFAPRL